MAEHFKGITHTVHTSNGGAEELIKGLIRIFKFNDDPNVDELVHFLRGQLKKGGGCKAFSFVPGKELPGVLQAIPNLNLWLTALDGFEKELQQNEPDLNTEINWDPSLQLEWRALILQLKWIGLQCLHVLKGSSTAELEPYSLAQFLSLPDLFHCSTEGEEEVLKYHFFKDLLNDLLRRRKGKSDSLPSQQNELFLLKALTENLKNHPNKKQERIKWNLELAEHLEASGQKELARSILEASLQLEEEEEGRELIRDWISSIG